MDAQQSHSKEYAQIVLVDSIWAMEFVQHVILVALLALTQAFALHACLVITILLMLTMHFVSHVWRAAAAAIL